MSHICANTRRPTPTISVSLNHLWPVIRLVVFLISGQGYFTFLYRYAKHNWDGERTNKHGLELALSARGGRLWHFLCILWANTSGYSGENSHKATGNTDLSSRVGQPGICGSTDASSRLYDFGLLPASFCSLLLTVSFSALFSSLSTVLFSSPLSTGLLSWLTSHADCVWDLPSLVFFRSCRRSHTQALYVSFAPKETKRFSDWLPHPQKWMPP